MAEKAWYLFRPDFIAIEHDDGSFTVEWSWMDSYMESYDEHGNLREEDESDRICTIVDTWLEKRMLPSGKHFPGKGAMLPVNEDVIKQALAALARLTDD